ncbi:MAG: nuclear transport factor 2 family protein [Ferruginibacter sp.]
MEIEEIENAYIFWKKAVIKADTALLDEVCTDGFSWTNNMGITRSKSEILSRTRSGNLQYLSWTDENMDINFQEENAILKSTQILKLKVFDQYINRKQHITVQFIKQNDSWRLATVGEF